MNNMFRVLQKDEESGGHVSDLTKRISAIGCHGKYPSNCERDLMNILELPVVPWLY